MNKGVVAAFTVLAVSAALGWSEGSRVHTKGITDLPAAGFGSGEPPVDGDPAVDTTCNFIGMASGDLVNNAYAGGTSQNGVSRTDLGIRFTGATVLTSWNGCCSPDANIAYSPGGSILLDTTSANANWAGVAFSSANSVTLTVTGYALANGAGTPVQSVTIPANVSGTYSTWTSRQVTFTQAVRSIKITGTANQWGIDTVLPILAPPFISSVNPNSGTQFGGTTITLTGIGLNSATGVTVGGVAATGVTVLSTTQISAVTPFSATAGAKDVRVTTPAGSTTLAGGFTYLAPTPALTITNNAASCTPLGTTVTMDLTLSGVVTNVVAGQIALQWDPAKLQPTATNPVQSGDSPFVVFNTINAATGNATILVSIAPGSTGGPVQSKIVARMRFVVVGASCNGTGTSLGFMPSANLPTTFTDGNGGSVVPQLVASPNFVVDDGAPVISQVPAPVTIQANAGSGNFAAYTLPVPVVTDACSPTSLTTTRSDGQSLSALWPVGTTTVTYRAVDPCNNVTTATTTVTVQPLNTMSFSASWVSPFGGGSGAVRPVSVSVLGSSGLVSRTANASVSGSGLANFSVTDLPVSNYTCATVEDATRSLRRRVTVSDAGNTWSTSTAALVLGDVINDEVIDVLDWGAYVVTNPNADLNSDGAVNATDGNIILANFGLRGDNLCGSGFAGAPDPIVSITVKELAAMGLSELAGADVNGDGVLDELDIKIVTGAR